MIRSIGVVVLVLFSSAFTRAQSGDSTAWNDLRFLLGEWVGAGGGTGSGQGSGWSTFSFDLQGRVIVRKNHAEYPAAKDRQSFTHDDLMIIYRETGRYPRAIYLDNEGHVIYYSVESSNTGRRVTFLSDSTSRGPRYRLSYSASGADTLAFEFDIAPPGKPDDFAPYIRATTRRNK